jgi:hypothetical protein
MRIRIQDLLDPGSGVEKFESGIRKKHPGFATLTLILSGGSEKCMYFGS